MSDSASVHPEPSGQEFTGQSAAGSAGRSVEERAEGPEPEAGGGVAAGTGSASDISESARRRRRRGSRGGRNRNRATNPGSGGEAAGAEGAGVPAVGGNSGSAGDSGPGDAGAGQGSPGLPAEAAGAPPLNVATSASPPGDPQRAGSPGGGSVGGDPADRAAKLRPVAGPSPLAASAEGPDRAPTSPPDPAAAGVGPEASTGSARPGGSDDPGGGAEAAAEGMPVPGLGAPHGPSGPPGFAGSGPPGFAGSGPPGFAGSSPVLGAAGTPQKPKIGDSRPAPSGRTPLRPDPVAPRGGSRAQGGGRDSRTSSLGVAAGNGVQPGGPGGADLGDDSMAGAPGAGGFDGPGGDRSAKKRRRGTRSRSTVERRPVEAVLIDDPVEIDDETLERRRGRERKGRPVGRYLMVVHAQPGATQIAVLEGRALIEHFVSRPTDDATQIDGNIYLGRVQNVLPGMEAAFVDIGTPKNAVLYRGDVRYDKDDLESTPADAKGGPTRGRLSGVAKDARIEQLLRTGQTILCQVTKNPIGTKGARLTQEVSLPGRFVVLIPGSDTYGISKRLSDEERKRLRRILDEVRPAGHGLIVRTAAEGATADELRRDVARLTQQWEQIEAMAKTSRPASLLYREPDMAVRVIREEFNRNYRGVVIDDRALYEEVRDYVGSINPELADRVEWAGDTDDPLPIFERYHVHEQIHKALDRKVWLPSGGSLIIERTEALTVIDVNTGKNVGTSNLEETVFRNNLEAAEEIARQLRLRDIGGIIVIDFIDMEIAANRAEVIKTFRGALARDKTRTQVFDISELGLVEMTRKRISEGLVESFSETCPTCGGRGIIFDESLL